MDSLVSKGVLEFVGTFVFLSVILSSTVKPDTSTIFAIGVGLMSAIFMVGGSTGGHLNPAVSVMMWLKDSSSFTLPMLGVYVVAQLLGGAGAFLVQKTLMNKV